MCIPLVVNSFADELHVEYYKTTDHNFKNRLETSIRYLTDYLDLDYDREKINIVTNLTLLNKAKPAITDELLKLLINFSFINEDFVEIINDIITIQKSELKCKPLTL